MKFFLTPQSHHKCKTNSKNSRSRKRPNFYFVKPRKLDFTDSNDPSSSYLYNKISRMLANPRGIRTREPDITFEQTFLLELPERKNPLNVRSKSTETIKIPKEANFYTSQIENFPVNENVYTEEQGEGFS